MAVEGHSVATGFNQPIIDEFRANGGKVGGMFEGSTLALLTTVGARSGLPRTSPVGWMEINSEAVVVGSAGGAPFNPSWYYNLVANPWLTVEVRDEKFQALAHVTQGEEREALWKKVIEIAPGYADYQKQTTRTIPVVVLRRQEQPDGSRVRGLGAELEEIHAWMRQEMATLRREVDDYVVGRSASVTGVRHSRDLATQLHTRCLTYCKSLTVHHTGEDDHAFPALKQRFPALEPILTKLREEHVVVARLNEEIEFLVADLDQRDPEILRAELDRLATALETHFQYEEDTMVAALNAMGPAPAQRL